MNLEPKGLITFEGRGKSSEPEFTWIRPIAPTALKFFNSTNYGNNYYDKLFVADANTGTIYDFELEDNRTKLKFEGVLKDRIAQDLSETVT